MPVHTGTPEGTWTTVANCSDIPTRECPTKHVDRDVVVSAAWLTGIPGLGDALAITPAVTPDPGTAIEAQNSFAFPVGGSTDVPESWQIGQAWFSPGTGPQMLVPPSMMPFPAGTPFWYRYEWRDTSNMCVRTLYVRLPDGLPAAPAATDITVGVTGDADDQQPLTVPGDGSTAALASMAWPAVCPPPDLYVPVGPAACGAPLPVALPAVPLVAMYGTSFSETGSDVVFSSGASSSTPPTAIHIHAVIPPGGRIRWGIWALAENVGTADLIYGPILLTAPSGFAFPEIDLDVRGGTSAPTTGSIVVWTT